MSEIVHLLTGVLDRGDHLTPRHCLVALACLTLVTYAILLVSGRGRV
jgi:hypothetical protein